MVVVLVLQNCTVDESPACRAFVLTPSTLLATDCKQGSMWVAVSFVARLRSVVIPTTRGEIGTGKVPRSIAFPTASTWYSYTCAHGTKISQREEAKNKKYANVIKCYSNHQK